MLKLLNCSSDAPVVKATFGAQFSPELLKEGDDVYFICKVTANPKAGVVRWYHEVCFTCFCCNEKHFYLLHFVCFSHFSIRSLLCNTVSEVLTCIASPQSEVQQQNLAEGILVTPKSLVIQKAHRTRAGRYSCAATNAVGTARSEPVTLNIRCE